MRGKGTPRPVSHNGTLAKRWRANPVGMLTRALWLISRAAIIAGICFILLYPLMYTIVTAFRPSKELFDPSVVWISRALTLANIQDAAHSMRLSLALPNTLILCAISCPLQVFTCMLTGYGFARYKFKGRGVVFALVLVTMIVPQQTIAIPTFLNFQHTDALGVLSLVKWLFGVDLSPNLLGTPYVYFLPSALGGGLRSGVFIFLFRQFFRGMPKELADSAYIDGCNAFRTFLRVMAPNAVPAIVTALLFSVVWHWNEYFYSMMYMGGTLVVSTALNGLQHNLLLDQVTISYSDPFEYATRLQAGVFISILPPLLLYVIFQKQFVQSVERSGIVG